MENKIGKKNRRSNKLCFLPFAHRTRRRQCAAALRGCASFRCFPHPFSLVFIFSLQTRDTVANVLELCVCVFVQTRDTVAKLLATLGDRVGNTTHLLLATQHTYWPETRSPMCWSSERMQVDTSGTHGPSSVLGSISYVYWRKGGQRKKSDHGAHNRHSKAAHQHLRQYLLGCNKIKKKEQTLHVEQKKKRAKPWRRASYPGTLAGSCRHRVPFPTKFFSTKKETFVTQDPAAHIMRQWRWW